MSKMILTLQLLLEAQSSGVAAQWPGSKPHHYRPIGNGVLHGKLELVSFFFDDRSNMNSTIHIYPKLEGCVSVITPSCLIALHVTVAGEARVPPH